jgi:hypothetical protein
MAQVELQALNHPSEAALLADRCKVEKVLRQQRSAREHSMREIIPAAFA